MDFDPQSRPHLANVVSVQPKHSHGLAHERSQLFAKLGRENKLSIRKFREALAILGPYPEKNMALLFEFLKTARSLKQGFIFLHYINYG